MRQSPLAPHVLYLAHDVSDAAVRRRVRMLVAGGARVTIAGFRRAGQPVTEVEGRPVLDLGRTRDGRFAHRILAIARGAGTLRRALADLGSVDVVVARNLEMLALARQVRAAGGRARIIYESLDIHRLLLRRDPVGTLLRALERRLLRDVSLVVTSSPAFTREYFEKVQSIRAPVYLLENKVSRNETDLLAPLPGPQPDAERPLRIGWFGILRCRKSLTLLAAFSRAEAGRFEIVLRGRPAERELGDVAGFAAGEPYMRFEGPYSSPEDLARIYAEVDFAWAIDFFEEGLNSRWLLPNRLYEGCRFGAVPLAMAGTETERYLRSHGIGYVLSEATPEALGTLFRGLDRTGVRSLAEAVRLCDESLFVQGREDGRSLVRAIGGVSFTLEQAA